ncbi:hypothetical protein ACVXHB_30265 [Escherichia coli]
MKPGLVPSALVVSRDVVQLNCSCCREVVRAPADQGWQWRNAPCLSLRCEGRYQEVDNTATCVGRTWTSRAYRAQNTRGCLAVKIAKPPKIVLPRQPTVEYQPVVGNTDAGDGY